MKKILLTAICMGLFVTAGCEDENSITNDHPSEQISETNIASPERKLLLNRAVQLQEQIQAGNLTPEEKTKQIEGLVADIERWNTQPDVQSIAVSTSLSTDDGRGPRGPNRQPCLLLPCDPIRVSNGWVCFNTGTAGCTAQGRLICTYACVRITL